MLECASAAPLHVNERCLWSRGKRASARAGAITSVTVIMTDAWIGLTIVPVTVIGWSWVMGMCSIISASVLTHPREGDVTTRAGGDDTKREGGGGLEVVHGQSNEKSFGAYEDNDAWFVCVCVSVMKEVPKKVVWRERRRQRFAWWRREKMTSSHTHTTPACSYVFSGSCTFSLSSNSQNYIWKHSVGKHSLKTNVPSTLTQFHDFRLTRTRYTISRRVWKFWWENVSVLKLYSDLSFTSPKKQRCQYYRSIFTLFLRMNAESVGRGDESLASLNVLI